MRLRLREQCRWVWYALLAAIVRTNFASTYRHYITQLDQLSTANVLSALGTKFISAPSSRQYQLVIASAYSSKFCLRTRAGSSACQPAVILCHPMVGRR